MVDSSVPCLFDAWQRPISLACGQGQHSDPCQKFGRAIATVHLILAMMLGGMRARVAAEKVRRLLSWNPRARKALARRPAFFLRAFSTHAL